jgi:hypothetical protein
VFEGRVANRPRYLETKRDATGKVHSLQVVGNVVLGSACRLSHRLGFVGNYKCSGDASIQCRKCRTLGFGEVYEMPICSLPRSLYPAWQVRDIVIVRYECELQDFSGLQPEQKCSRLGNGEAIRCCLRENSKEAELRDRASRQFGLRVRCQSLHPTSHSFVKFVLEETQRDKSVHVEKIFHGKVERISSTCLLVSSGASGLAVRTGSLVRGSTTMLVLYRRDLCGVNTMRPPSVFTSSASPARRPSFRRRGPGRTTWPLVDTLVSMVRQSYPTSGDRAMKLADGCR